MQLKYSYVFYSCNVLFILIVMYFAKMSVTASIWPIVLISIIYFFGLYTLMHEDMRQNMTLSKWIDFSFLGIGWGVIGFRFLPITIIEPWDQLSVAIIVAAFILMMTRELWARLVD